MVSDEPPTSKTKIEPTELSEGSPHTGFIKRILTPSSEQEGIRVLGEKQTNTGGGASKELFGNDIEAAQVPQGCEIQRAITPKGERLWVGWNGDGDPENPRNWPAARKWTITLVDFFFTAIVVMSISGYSITVPSIQAELKASHELSVSGVSFFTLTFGAAPLLLSPLSEVYGRRWIFVGSAIVFWLFQLPQALAQNIETMLIARFISGIGGSTAIALSGGTLADLFNNAERGFPMACFSLSAFAPLGLAPIIFGYLAQYRGFRDIYWISFGLTGISTILVFFLQRETRDSVLLARKAVSLRATTGDARFSAEADDTRASVLTILRISLTRPLKLFFTEPVLVAFTVFLSFAWGVLYLLLVSIPITFQGLYGFDLGQIGLVYTSLFVASWIGLALSMYTDKLYLRDVSKRGPEARLWAAMIGGVIFCVGCWVFVWTSWKTVHWIAPCIGLTILVTGAMLIYITAFSYVSDCFVLVAASALAAMNFWRNLVGAVFPLFATQMYDGLGIHGAGSLVAGIATVLALVPFIAFSHGSKLRANSRYAKELLAAEGRH